MNELLRVLVESLDAGRTVAVCRLVETRGSTPQKAGAMMLVFPDGSQAGTLGGGCVEAEVKRRAIAALDGGQAEIATFQLDSDYGWDDGLICGGRMQVLLDPLAEPQAAAYYRAVAERVARRGGVVEAIVLDAAKSRLPAAACFALDEDVRLLAAIRGEGAASADNDRAMPPQVLEHLPLLADRPRPSAVGGVAYLPTLPRCRLVIVGGGHVGQALATLAAELDFDVWVVDDRADYANADRFPKAQRHIVGPIGPTLRDLEITADTYCVIVTRGHNHDEEALFHLAQRGARYVGLIGSRRKIKLIFDDLLAEGISAEALEQVYAPLGIDIGSQTVPEIAVSIAAELVSHRNRNRIVPGRPERIPVTA